MKFNIRRTLVIIMFMFTFCGILSVNTQAATKNISFKKKNVTMYAGQKRTIKVKVSKSYKNKKIIYSSSNKKIAKVNKKGVVKAVKKGNVKIYAKIKGTNKKAKCKVKVLQNIKKITIMHKEQKYYVGQKYQLQCKISPMRADETIAWKSSNTKIATVDKNGLLKIESAGRVEITAYAVKTQKKSVIAINAEEVPEIRFKEGKSATMEFGAGLQLNVLFINHKRENMIFKSENNSLATVSQTGYVVAQRPGEVSVSATTPDGKEKITIHLIITNKKGFITNSMINNIDLDDCENLMIVAHPDDVSLWGGAHLKEGKRFIVCMTNQYTANRKSEYRNVLKASGSKGIILDYPDEVRDKDGKVVRDEWTNSQEGIEKDLAKIINVKNWNKIATHSPTGETGHVHHKATDKYVVEACTKYGKMDKLWYFGKYYAKGSVPVDLPRITEEERLFKQSLIDLYVGEQNPIEKYWVQMIPHENWVKATEYVAGK